VFKTVEPTRDGLGKQFREYWKVARKAALFLRSRYVTGEIRIIGSLLKRERFHEESDIDLVVEKFSMADKMDAERELERCFSQKVDLIPLKSLPDFKQKYFVEQSIGL
jgi:predicted nucleotidyltransferase